MSVYTDMIKLEQQKQVAEEKLKRIKEKIEEHEVKVMRQMEQDGLAKCELPSGVLKFNRIVRASAGGDMPALVAAMRAAGEEDLIGETVNGTKLGAWVREFDPDNCLSPEQIIKKLPPPLRGKINVTEQLGIRVTLKKKG
jgi:hypothetical protein